MHNTHFTILWDMDGVIADTAEAHFRAWSQTFSEMNLPYTRKDFTRVFGMDNPTTLTALYGTRFSPAQGGDIFAKKEKRFLDSIPGNIRLHPCVNRWLLEFQRANFLQVIASSAPDENINAVVNYLGIRTFFSHLVSAEGMPGKPDPAVFLQAAQVSNTPLDHCVIIEDSLPGIFAARLANMKCIAVSTTHPSMALMDADLVVKNCCSLTWELLSEFLGFKESG